MTPWRFFHALSLMRYYQKEYRKTRNPHTRWQMEQAEQVVDGEIARVLAILEENPAVERPQDLFNEPSNEQ